MAVSPQGGLAFAVITGGTAVLAVPAGVSGGYITNPSQASDQGISDAENLIVDPVGLPALVGNNTSTSLVPGQSFSIIPNSVTPVRVNAATSGHKFTVVYWL